MRVPFIGDILWSKKNGLIRVTKSGAVWSGGIKQTSERYAHMWSDALSKAGIPQAPARVLVLGLAGGGCLPALRGHFESSDITCVEYDPAMVEIARARLSADDTVRIILSDAKEALDRPSEPYNLIIVDLFVGIRPAPVVYDDSFWELIKKRLEPGGCAILNVAITPTGIYTAKKHFARSRAWLYDTNTLCSLY